VQAHGRHDLPHFHRIQLGAMFQDLTGFATDQVAISLCEIPSIIAFLLL
jgi:hypothetical protein